MGGGGKGGTTVQKTEIPPEVMARYNAVNARAEQVAAKPFQQYQGQFVAPLTGTQSGAIENITNTQGTVAPFYGVGAGLTMQGAQGVGPLNRRDIAYYESPYTQAVAAPTYQALRQQQGQELSQQQANAIRSGAAFGDRSGLERANMMRQQALGTAQAMAPIYQQGYQTALQTATGQQGVLQQDQARRLAAGQQMAALGTGLQGAQLQQAQAQLAAGTAQQQTQQADLTARYQQFLQERGYDFQTAQFLANIAMGTGALSGSTTSTTQPMPFFSDRRLKKDVEQIGQTKDGLPVYEFRYKGEEERGEPHRGFMAQDVEKKYPDAVGLAGGYKTVDYGKVADHQEERGLGAAMDRSWMGGAVHEPGHFERGGYARGGLGNFNFAPEDMQALLQSQQQSFGPFGGGGPYGQPSGQTPFGNAPSIVPKANLPVARLQPHGAPPKLPEGMGAQALRGMNDVVSAANTFDKAGELGTKIRNKLMGEEKPAGNTPSPASPAPAPTPTATSSTTTGNAAPDVPKPPLEEFPVNMAQGGLAPQRRHYAAGGINPYDPNKDPSTAIEDVVDEGSKSPQELLGQQKAMSGQGGGGSGGGGLGSALGTAAAAINVGKFLFSLSDARLKDNIRHVGETHDGQNIYAYDMGDGRTQLGLMAQEVMQRKPEAVGERDGFLTLDYDKAVEDAAMPPREGGIMPRHGAKDGGEQPAMSEEEYNNAMQRAAEITRLKESGKREGNYGITGAVIPSGAYAGDKAYGAYQVMGKNVGPWTEQALGRRMTPDEFLADREAQDKVFQHVWGGNLRKYGNVPDAVSMWASGRPISGNQSRDLVSGVPTSSYVANFMKAYDPNSPYAAAAPQGGVRPPANIPEGGRAAPSEGGIKGFWSENKGTILPVLAGLGSMAQSRSPFLAGALLEGIGGGARAYADINRELAATELTEAQTPGALLRSAQEVIKVYPDGTKRIFVPGKGYVTPSEYRELGSPEVFDNPKLNKWFKSNVDGLTQKEPTTTQGGVEPIKGPEGPKAPGAPGAPSSTAVYKVGLDDEATRAAKGEIGKMEDLPMAQREARAREIAAKRQSYENEANAAINYSQDLNMMSNSLLRIANSGGALTSGPLDEARFRTVAVLNAMARGAGLDDRYQISGASDRQIAEKARVIMSAGQTKGFGQTANESLNTLLSATPNTKMEPQAIRELLASLSVAKQRALDRNAYFRNYSSLGKENEIGIGADANYQRQYNEERYMQDKKNLLDLMSRANKQTGETLYEYALGGGKDPAMRERVKKELTEKYGPQIWRYLYSTTN